MQLIQGILKKSQQEQVEFLKKKWNDYPLEHDFEYHMFRANLNYFKPALFGKASELYRSVKIVKELSAFNLVNEKLHKQISYEGLEHLNMSKQRIYCTFHFGSYQLIHFFLAKNELSYALLLNNEYSDLKTDWYNSINDFFRERENLSGHFQTINVENPSGPLSIARALRNENNLVCYLDGNTGIGGLEKQDQQLIPINFFGKKIHVRTGIAHMSHTLNVPITPVVCHRDNYSENGVRISFLPELKPPETPERETYEKKITMKLYQILEEVVNTNPAEWECWTSVGHFIDKQDFRKISVPLKKNQPLKGKYIFNSNRYGLVEQNSKHHIFDTFTYSLHELKGSSYKIISLSQTRINGINYSDGSLDRLIEMEVLIPYPN